MTEIPEEEADARKIEKRRSWREISSSQSSVEEASADDYAVELELFELGRIEKSLWAKHLVEAKGDEEEAKWLYVKERAVTAPARRAEVDRLEKQKLQAAEDAVKKRQEQDSIKKLAEEAHERAKQERATRVEQDKLQALRDKEAQENGFKLIVGLVGFLVFTAIVLLIGSQ